MVLSSSSMSRSSRRASRSLRLSMCEEALMSLAFSKRWLLRKCLKLEVCCSVRMLIYSSKMRNTCKFRSAVRSSKALMAWNTVNAAKS